MNQMTTVVLLTTALGGCVMPTPGGGSSSAPLQNIAAVSVAPNNAEVAENVESALPFVGLLLSEIACLPPGDFTWGRRLPRYSTPDSYLNRFVAPWVGMQTNRSRCLKVVTVQGWQMKTKNSLLFSALYVSPSSGESRWQSYLLIRDPSGQWQAYF